MASRKTRRSLVPAYCEICGYDFHVTKHRIKPGRNGGKYILGNVIALCPNHHAEADRNQFSQHHLFQIVQERMRYFNALSEGNTNGKLQM